MSESRSHKIAANKIANKYNTEYNSGKGADVVGDNVAVEVETEHTVNRGLTQLQGYNKRTYIAGSNQKAVEKAKKITRGTTIGVMDRNGNIVKSSSRKT